MDAAHAALPRYRGPFRAAEAERLLWRAGFGPRPGEAHRLARRGLEGAVRSLTRPGPERLVGRPPVDEKGRPLAPADAYGHDLLWWLDRMVRTSRPLVERMTLVWHDWFATSNAGVGSQRLMLRQNALLRRRALGPFDKLLLDVTADPAMLLWLNGAENRKGAPNENYARELMELFTLGAGRGYGEADVREQARALTGFRYDWARGVGPTNFRYDRSRHDGGRKRILGHGGTFDWRDSCHLCLQSPAHASFLVRKLWSYFVPVPPDRATEAALERLYRESHYQVRPLLEAILQHPALYEGPRMVKPPVVYTAGLLRRLRRRVDTTAWVWQLDQAGQRLFYPPSVAGWDDTRWLDTGTFRGRWTLAQTALRPYLLDERSWAGKVPASPERLVRGALEAWGRPPLEPGTHAALVAFAGRALAGTHGTWKTRTYPVLVANALRQLVAVAPELQAA